MNWRHFQAFVWLRWRLLANGWRRGGKLNFVLMMILAVGALIASVPLFIGCLLIGMFAFADAKPAWLLYAWDAIIAAFVLLWGVGVLSELQRTEALSMSKFLHLPVSVNGVFVINYLSSLVRLTTILFAPVMLGFGLGLTLGRGGAAGRAAAVGRVSVDGHGADLPVSGVAGFVDEQSPTSPDRGRRRHDVLRIDLSVAEPAELHGAVGPATAGRSLPCARRKDEGVGARGRGRKDQPAGVGAPSRRTDEKTPTGRETRTASRRAAGRACAAQR